MTDHEHHQSEIAHDIEEIRDDLAMERATLDESIKHDYSTAETGIVPLDRRRPMWHFMGLWTTFVAGFSYMFLGFEIHDGGHSLASTVLITLVGYGMYVAYAMTGSFLGSRTGQTHALLTRSIFGVVGSWVVSAFILVAPLGWVGYQANLLVTLWNGFYGWSAIFTLTLLIAGVMILNNLLGFTGISVFARYLVTPILILWCIYMVLRAVIFHSSRLGGTPHATFAFPFWVAVVAVIGFSMWGNEPDFWRYGRPRFSWPLPTYLFSAFWFTLFVVAGWMMEALANTSDTAAVFRYTVHFSLFGAFWLAWIIATISQFAINDGNYYESVNAGQNLFSSIPRWPRVLTCLLVAGGGVVAADLVNFHFLNGWFKVASFLAVSVPCATVIMVADHFLLPRLFTISRPLLKVPHWEEAGLINWPATIALLGAVFFGVTGTASWPHGWLEAAPPNSWGPVPLEAWAMAGGLYIGLVAVSRALGPVRSMLGFAKTIPDAAIASTAVVDVASAAGVAPATAPAPMTA
jgi:purine-cytosine permease-like protein